MHKKIYCLAVIAGLALVIGFNVESAPRRSSSSGSRSSSSSKPASRPSAEKLYNRSSDGYTKPAPKASAPKQSASSQTETKKTTTTASSGHSKPSVATTGNDYSKPNDSAKTPDTKAKTATDYRKPTPATPQRSEYSKPSSSSSASAVKQTAHAKGNRFDADFSRSLKMQQAAESRAAYETKQNQFKKPPVVSTASSSSPRTSYSENPTVRNVKRYGDVGYDDLYRKREQTFGATPTVVYQSAPSYGVWDSPFLWWALLNDSSFGYHRRNDPDYQAWHKEAMALAATNAELKAKLAAQQSAIAAMQSNNVPVNPAYLPSAVTNDPTLALSDEVVTNIPVAKPLIRIATGVQGGRYHQVGNALLGKVKDKFDVELIPTSGSAENLRLLKQGEVDAAIVQSDAPAIIEKMSGGIKTNDALLEGTVYVEYVTLIGKSDSSVNSVKDLTSDHTLYVGPEGSGTALTWTALCLEEPKYKSVQVRSATYDEALDAVRKDKNSFLLFVAGSDAPLLKKAERGGGLKLIPVDDEAFTEAEDASGKKIYDSLLLTADAYPKLQNGELQTLSVDAVWTLSESWVKKFGDSAFDELNIAVTGVISDLHIHSLKASPFKTATVFWIVAGAVLIIGGCWFFVTKVNVT